MKRREDLSAPRHSRRLSVHYDREAFGRFSEAIARYLGTARFLVWQTVVIAAWLLWNVATPASLQFDPLDQGLVRLTLVLSLQASYAAPLILLAQNRQEARDRAVTESDRHTAERTQADTEFLAREIAGVRIALADVLTADDLRSVLGGARSDDVMARLDSLDERIGDLTSRMDRAAAQAG